MKITKIHLQNIGVFEDTTIEFPSHHEGENGTDIHIFTGENGSGKSTLLLALISSFLPNHLSFNNSQPPNNTTLYFLQQRLRVSGDKIINKIKTTFSVDDREELNSFEGQSNSKTFINNNDLPKLKLYHKINSGSSILDENLMYAVFIYSGHRAIIDYNFNPNIELHPLHNGTNLIKQTTAKQFFKFVKEQIVKSLWAERKGDVQRVESVNLALNAVKEFIKEVTNLSVEFELDADDTEKVLLLVSGQVVNYDALPDGLRSLMSWIADLLWRLDRCKWENNTPLLERRVLLFLDEIEVHLHPSWQRKVLPAVKKLFKNAQVFISTHSPFVVNSIDGAFVHRIELEGKNAKVLPAVQSNNATNIQTVLREIFGVSEEFGLEVSEKLNKFIQIKNDIFAKKEYDKPYFLELAKSLIKEGEELELIVAFELRQLSKVLKEDFAL